MPPLLREISYGYNFALESNNSVRVVTNCYKPYHTRFSQKSQEEDAKNGIFRCFPGKEVGKYNILWRTSAKWAKKAPGARRVRSGGSQGRGRPHGAAPTKGNGNTSVGARNARPPGTDPLRRGRRPHRPGVPSAGPSRPARPGGRALRVAFIRDRIRSPAPRAATWGRPYIHVQHSP